MAEIPKLPHFAAAFMTGIAAGYGIAIGDALSKGRTSTDDLVKLRDHVRDIVGAQGDLVAALKALDGEIARSSSGAKTAPPVEERFVAQIDGLTIPAGTKNDIEQAIQQAVMAEIAKLDTGGDLIATPLSQAKLLPSVAAAAFLAGTMGFVAQRPRPGRQ